jgi:putative transposase
MCRVLKVSRSGYYQWIKYPKSTRKIEDMKLTQKIVEIHHHSRQTYGSPRIHQQLVREDYQVSKKRVERLMKEAGIHAMAKKKYRATTDSKHTLPVAANSLNRNFSVNKLNQFWVADITYIYTQEGWLYLSTIMDLYSRKIVGWSMKNRITQELVLEALDMAIKQRKPSQGLLLHSDRGSQYASDYYQILLAKNGILCSMSRKGNCFR